jgi:hypothetical protein
MGAVEASASLKEPVRPGTGGRMPRQSAYAQTEATAELYEELGPPRVSVVSGTTLMVWDVSEDGDGLIAARLSSRDLQGGETAMGQVHGGRELAKRFDLKPRRIVVTINNSGAKDYEDRPDFELIEQDILSGGVRWVAWRDPDRIAREEHAFFTFLRLMKRSGSTLYLANLGRAVDWTSDRFQLSVQSAVAADERERIYLRCHGPLHNRWLAEGRGWPACGGFGFRRNKTTKFLEIDPEQWPFVEMAFYNYLELEPRNGTTKAGYEGVAETLEKAGCSLGKERWRQILKNPIYVTGEYCVRRKGELIACEPINLEGRGIPADVFQRVQELSTLRTGKTQRNPAGTFIYNGICWCGTCGQKLTARYVKGSDRPAYRHPSPVPASCRGRIFDAALVEANGIRELLRLHSCQELQLAWTARPQIELTNGNPVLSADQIAELSKRARALEQSKKGLIRDFNQRLVQQAAVAESASGVLKVDEGMFQQMIGGIDEEIDELKTRIERANTLNQVREASIALRRESESVLEAMKEILTEEIPEDLALRVKRAALVKTLLSKVVLIEADGKITMELHGPLVPKHHPPFDAIGHAADALQKPEIDEQERPSIELRSSLSDGVGPDGVGTAVGSSRVLRTGAQGSPYALVGSKPLPPIGSRPNARKPVTDHDDGSLTAAWSSPVFEVGLRRPRVLSRFDPTSLRRLAELLAEGQSVSGAARVLEAEGAPTPKGRPLERLGLARHLRSRRASGAGC